MKKKQIKLRVVSHTEGNDEFDAGEKESEFTDITTTAELSMSGDRVVIEYDEVLSSGDDTVTHTAISFDKNSPNVIFLTRTGDVQMTCVIEEKTRYRFSYDVGFAVFELIAAGKKVKNSLLDTSGTLKMSYDVEMHGMMIRTCDMRVTII
ncbi:MAG: DUF1934 domain-containing protein [Clostridia bacterium]|nr:DUF1934 domain-containing protein [Clostridia bacterium]